MINKLKLANLFFISMMLICTHFVYGESLIQLNSYAENADGGVINNTEVDFLIMDPAGHRVGYDPVKKERYKEFNAGYGDSGIDDHYTVEAMFPPTDGTYTIEVIGDDLMAFSLSASIHRHIADERSPNLELEGVTDKGYSSTFQIIYNSDPAKQPGDLKRIATPSSLKQDITLSRKLDWIDNDGLMNSLLKKVEAIEASIAKGKNDTAKNQLNALVNEINAQKGKQIDEKAVKVFLEDIQYIIDHL